MKWFVKLCAASFLSLAVLGTGMAEADRPAKKRKPTFLEQIFGTPAERAERRKERRMFGRNERGEYRSVRVISDKPRQRRSAVNDDDPEGDPGLGMGNLRYVAPRLAAVSGVSLAEPRPADAAAGAIHDQLAGSGPAFQVLPETRDAVIETYRKRDFRPVWLENGSLSDRGKAVLALLAAADEEGLDPAAYLPSGLTAHGQSLPVYDATAMARLDIDLFAAALRYARDASGGLFDPRKLSRYHDIDTPSVQAAEAARMLAWSPYPAEYLKSLHPSHPAYAAMKAALAELRGGPKPAEVSLVAEGPVVKRGATDPRIPLVRQKLSERGYGDNLLPSGANPLLLDQELSIQLRLFQKASRITVSGVLGPQTVAALNTDISRGEEAKLVNNMERLRWLPRDLGRRHIFVNPPAYEAEVVEDGREVWSTRVIVGKPNTQTWSFHDEMELVVFNPSWGVPQSIIAKEYLPKLRRDPGYLDRLGFKVVNQKGKVVPSRSIRWASYGGKVPYGIQQPPGAKNALGEIKFLFPNTHDIYMHDTPHRELFEEDQRAFSHGCVRVQNPREFASVVLGWDSATVADHIGTPRSETVRLKEKIPVHIAYFTAWPDETGRIRYFEDIYGRDKAMENARSTAAVAQR
jgi:murein L,D-transpeptidase YcbB/YkuD